ncbi:hypothetical protein ACP6L2_17820 [Sphingobacterium lactis]|uniref:hypothetical protein n=1 Tax=Sphingobacterium lactis TaxID=797291 RepID=UPI003F8022AA
MKITISSLLLVFCGTFMLKAQTINPDQVLQDLLISKRNLEQYNDPMGRKYLEKDGKLRSVTVFKKEYQKNIDLIKKNSALFAKYIADTKFNNRDSMVFYNYIPKLESNISPYQTTKLKYFDIVNTYLINYKENELPTKLKDAHTPPYMKGIEIKKDTP